jgi:hypothetical protein
MQACRRAVVSLAPVLSQPQSATASRKRFAPGEGGGGGGGGGGSVLFTAPLTAPGLARRVKADLR